MRPRVFVTGCARGIGRAIAMAFAAAGWDVVANDVIALDDTVAGVQAAGGQAAALPGSVADLEGLPALVAGAFAAFGGLEALVNNAGVQVARRADMMETTPESYDRVMGTNLRGPFFLTQAVARRWLADPVTTHPRSIISMASVNSVMASINRAEYCLSKTGVSMMTKLFALRLAEARVGVFEIRPGVIRTDMTAGVQADYDRRMAGGELGPVARWGEPEDVARVAVALAGGAFHYSTGQAFYVDGGMHIERM
jgi:NAD(P)-dependent dehydrogenase (short-subunit alcohol dehydrogenase family)